MLLVSCGIGSQPDRKKNKTVCELCPEGTYKEIEGSEDCKTCPGNKTTLQDGATNKTTDCVSKYMQAASRENVPCIHTTPEQSLRI